MVTTASRGSERISARLPALPPHACATKAEPHAARSDLVGSARFLKMVGTSANGRLSYEGRLADPAVELPRALEMMRSGTAR